ncbi:hypothetical protein D3C78_1181020 [compost metagenome]
MHHVVGAHVVNHIDAGFFSQKRTVADLHGQRLIRPVQHGLAMKTDHVDIAGFKPVTVEEGFDRRGMGKRQLALCLTKIAGTLAPFANGFGCHKRLLPDGPQAGIIGEITARPVPHHAFAIRAQQGDIDAVHRCPAHQPDRRFDLAHAPLPFNIES